MSDFSSPKITADAINGVLENPAAEARSSTAQQQAWQRFAAKHKRIYGSLPRDQYHQILAHAEAQGRTPFQQIWLESCAYRNHGYVPSEAVLAELSALSAEVRRIGNNLNQLAYQSNRFGRFLAEKQAKQNLQMLEARLEDAVLKLTASHF